VSGSEKVVTAGLAGDIVLFPCLGNESEEEPVVLRVVYEVKGKEVGNERDRTGRGFSAGNGPIHAVRFLCLS
jgi:hypothetical protein